MNLRRGFEKIRSECSLLDLDKKGIKYKLELDENIYGDRIYKVIVSEDCGNGKNRKGSRV